MKNRNYKWIRLPLKVLLWLIVGIFFLIILLVVAMQIPVVQNFAAQKAVTYLREKLDTEVTLKSINIGFPKTVNIKGLYIADQLNDTLLYAGEVNVGVDMFKLIKNKLFIRSVELEHITGNVYRQYPDTTFNFSFILNAFASQDTTTQTRDTSAPMEINLKNIKLSEIRFLYADTLNGVKARVYIGEFNTSFSKFDLNKLILKTEEISLSNSSFSLLQTPVLGKSPETSEAAPLPDLSFNDILIKNFRAEYRDMASGNHLKGLVGNLELNADSLDLIGKRIALKRFILSNSNFEFSHSRPQQIDTIIAEVATEQGIEKQVAAPEWIFTLASLELQNNNLDYNNLDSIPASKEGIDFNHIEISNLNVSSNNISAQPGNIKLTLNNFAFKEKSGFQLKEFRSEISYDTANITLAGLLITTPNSRISDHLEANFSSITNIADSIEKINLVLNFNQTRIGFTDVLFFSPELADNPQIKIKQGEVIDISGHLSGSLQRLSVEDLAISNNRATSISLSGTISNVLDPKLVFADINGLLVRTTSRDVFSYISKTLIPQSMTIPPVIALSGNVEGYLKNFNADLNLKTSFGNVSADVKMNPPAGNIETAYIANLTVKELDLGKILNQPDTLGPVSLQASVEGIGTAPDSLNASVKAIVTSAFYNQYTYKDLNLEGFIVNRSFHGEIWMHDDNLDFNYTGYVNLHPDSLAFLFDLKLIGADMAALNLSKEELKFSGAISADLAKRFGPNPLGKVKIYDVRLIQAGLDCPVDSIIVQSTYDNDSSQIEIRSVFLNAILRGEIVLKDLANTVIPHLNRYFEFSTPDSIQLAGAGAVKGRGVPEPNRNLAGKNVVSQNFNFSLTLEDPNLICKNLVPSLKRFTPLTLKGRYSSDEQALIAKAVIPMIDYNGIVIDSLMFDVTSDKDRLEYKLHAAEISNPSLALEEFDFRGEISDNKINYKVNIEKADSFNVLRTSGVFTKTDNDYFLILDEPLVLNNTAWNIDPDNKITFSDKGLDAQKVILSGKDQLVSIITQPGDDVPLKVTFEDFNLANVSLIIEKDKELARGQLNGHFILFKVNGISAFTSDLNIDSLRFMEIPVGNLSLLADNSKNAEQFDVELSLTGNGNDMTVQGNYTARDSTGILNLDVNIPRLNLATIEPFTFGQVSRMSGFLNGGINIRGTTTNPDLTGDLTLNEVTFNAPFANTYLRVNNNTIRISDRRLLLNDLTLVDSTNHSAQVNGYADFSDITNLTFDFRITTEDFLAMNSRRGKEDVPIYGTVLLDSDIRVRGNPSNPIINMQVTLNNGTEVTYVLPETSMSLNESEGIVIFADSISDYNNIIARDTLQQVRSSIEGISLDASIKFEPEATLKMLVDPVAGDSMYVSGEGVLNFSMEPGGQMNLSGKYDISSGGYNLTLNEFIKREFTLRDGSSITWTGDIMDALIDLTAQYTVKTSPMLLLEDQIQGMEEAERGAYRNQLTFYVLLKMKGTLTKPEISFEIAQPENEEGAMNGTVNSKLNELKTDESQMNKQVFALLTLNRFLGQDPFETGNAPMTVESATRASASKLLTQQFSTLSEKYIKGVDLDVGVTSFEDYSSGGQQGRTQLNLGVSKELFDDRVSVQVGGNVELEGEHARNNDVSDIAGNVKVEYKLTPNGRYRLKGYRRIEYEDPIEGELINTGIGVSYTRDFRRLRQLFMSEKKRAELREKRNAELINQGKTGNEQP